MNSAILHGARPGDFRSSSQASLKGQLAGIARQMGMDVNSLGPQADNFLSMLDDMAENNPKEYQNFVMKQKEDYDILQGKSKMRQNEFLPKPGFVVKTTAVCGQQTEGSKVFVNFCCHEAIERPMDQLRNPVEGSRVGADGLHIPMLVSDSRDCFDNSGDLCLALDIVFNPWVLEQADASKPFKSQLVLLGLQWAEQEAGLRLCRKFKFVKATYKGGTGEKCATPCPFPIAKAGEQAVPIEQRTSNSSRNADESSQSVSSEDTSGKRDALHSPLTLNSPIDLVRMEHSEDKDEQISLCINKGGVNKKTQKPLIEELGDPVKSQEKNKPAVKKGFLAEKKNPKLYDDEGSIEGGKAGVYARFMDRCKVVDMSTMPKEQQQAMMREHAGPPPSQEKKNGNNAALPKPSFNGVKKGFLETGSSLYPEGSSEGAFKTKSQAEFEKLMSLLDPELAEGFKYEGEQNDDVTDLLKDIANVLIPEPAADHHSLPAINQETTQFSTQGVSEGKKSTKACENKDIASGQFTMELLGDTTVHIFINLGDFNDEDIKNAELDASERLLRVKVLDTKTIDIPLSFDIDTTSVKAAFKKKIKTLKVTFQKKVS